MLQKWILHFHLLKCSHQKWLLGKGMSHQITGLITRTSALLPELHCLRLLCQQVLGNVQPEQSPLSSPLRWQQHTNLHSLQEGHTPGIPNLHGAILTALGPRLCLVWWEAGICSPWRDLQAKDGPWKTQHPASFQPASRTRLSWDPQLQGSPLHSTGRAPLAQWTQRRSQWWSKTPMEPQCPSPQTASFNVANKHNHHVLIVRALSSFFSWGHNPLKSVWSESVIQHENSLLTQCPTVTPRCTMEGKRAWPDRRQLFIRLQACQAASSSPVLWFTPPGKLQW